VLQVMPAPFVYRNMWRSYRITLNTRHRVFMHSTAITQAILLHAEPLPELSRAQHDATSWCFLSDLPCSWRSRPRCKHVPVFPRTLQPILSKPDIHKILKCSAHTYMLEYDAKCLEADVERDDDLDTCSLLLNDKSTPLLQLLHRCTNFHPAALIAFPCG